MQLLMRDGINYYCRQPSVITIHSDHKTHNAPVMQRSQGRAQMTRDDEPKSKSNFFFALRAPVANAEVKTHAAQRAVACVCLRWHRKRVSAERCRAPGSCAPFTLNPKSCLLPERFHGDAVNMLMFGQKVWLLQPPPCAVYSTVPIVQHMQQLSSASNTTTPPLQCMQGAGDAFFIPRGWGHAVMNTHTSVGYHAAELTTAHRRY